MATADEHCLAQIDAQTRGDDLRGGDLGELEHLGAPGAALAFSLGGERGLAGAAVLAGEAVHGQTADLAALADKSETVHPTRDRRGHRPTFVEHAGDHCRRKWPTWAPTRRRDAQWALSLACLHLVEPEAPQLDGGQRLEANAYLRRVVLVPEVPTTIDPEDRAWKAWFDRWSLPLRAISDARFHAFLEAARTTALDGTHRVLASNSVAALPTIVRATFTAARKRRLIVWGPLGRGRVETPAGRGPRAWSSQGAPPSTTGLFQRQRCWSAR